MIGETAETIAAGKMKTEDGIIVRTTEDVMTTEIVEETTATMTAETTVESTDVTTVEMTATVEIIVHTSTTNPKRKRPKSKPSETDRRKNSASSAPELQLLKSTLISKWNKPKKNTMKSRLRKQLLGVMKTIFLWPMMMTRLYSSKKRSLSSSHLFSSPSLKCRKHLQLRLRPIMRRQNSKFRRLSKRFANLHLFNSHQLSVRQLPSR
mmetsp:Transcript_30228/g.46215  ORF Transcript_30228/g.46215 Transcript_30228/m.46215 type:complete len:208 (-) Transcript_30228:886-1509(-)